MKQIGGILTLRKSHPNDKYTPTQNYAIVVYGDWQDASRWIDRYIMENREKGYDISDVVFIPNDKHFYKDQLIEIHVTEPISDHVYEPIKLSYDDEELLLYIEERIRLNDGDIELHDFDEEDIETINKWIDKGLLIHTDGDFYYLTQRARDITKKIRRTFRDNVLRDFPLGTPVRWEEYKKEKRGVISNNDGTDIFYPYHITVKEDNGPYSNVDIFGNKVRRIIDKNYPTK